MKWERAFEENWENNSPKTQVKQSVFRSYQGQKECQLDPNDEQYFICKNKISRYDPQTKKFTKEQYEERVPINTQQKELVFPKESLYYDPQSIFERFVEQNKLSDLFSRNFINDQRNQIKNKFLNQKQNLYDCQQDKKDQEYMICKKKIKQYNIETSINENNFIYKRVPYDQYLISSHSQNSIQNQSKVKDFQLNIFKNQIIFYNTIMLFLVLFTMNLLLQLYSLFDSSIYLKHKNYFQSINNLNEQELRRQLDSLNKQIYKMNQQRQLINFNYDFQYNQNKIEKQIHLANLQEQRAILQYLLPLQEIRLTEENLHKIEPLDYSKLRSWNRALRKKAPKDQDDDDWEDEEEETKVLIFGMKDFRDRSQKREKGSINYENEEKFKKSKNKVRKLHKLLALYYQLKVEPGQIYQYLFHKKKGLSKLDQLDQKIKIVVEKIRKEQQIHYSDPYPGGASKALEAYILPGLGGEKTSNNSPVSAPDK